MASSFHKTTDSAASVMGTKAKNNLLIVSSGIPSLDHIVGGGLPIGASFVVEEDTLGNYSRVLTKYFLAEGVVCKHDLFIASADEDTRDIVNELPTPCAAPPPDEVSTTANNLDKMKIAWRYEGLGQVDSSFGSNSNFGHHFDLSKHMDAETIKQTKITFWNGLEKYGTQATKLALANGFKNNLFTGLLQNIRNAVSKPEYQASSKNKSILRISIQSLGSPIWLAQSAEDDTSYSQDLKKFMYLLSVLLRDTTAVAFITIPSHLFEDETLVKRILFSADNAVRLESFAGSSKETNPVYKEYHGLFHVTMISAINSLVPYIPPAMDLAFKLRRKKFVIEKLHLPPELQESSEREQDDITATPTMTCGGFRKKDIDF